MEFTYQQAAFTQLHAPVYNCLNDCLSHVFQKLLDHEVMVTTEINKVVDICLKDKDYTTHNFMQWYVAEQIEEEALARKILDKLKLIGDDKGGLYLFDRDITTMTTE